MSIIDLLNLLVALLPFFILLGAVTGKPRAGKGGRFTAGGVNMVVSNWSANDTVEDLDATNFEGGGFVEHVAGCFSCDLNVSGNWDAHHIPFVNPPNLAPGNFLTNVTSYVNVVDGSFYSFASFFVVSVSTTVNVHQAVQISIAGKSDGPYTQPDVNV